MKTTTLPLLALLLILLTTVTRAQQSERFEIAGGGSVVGHVVDSNAHSIVVRDSTGREMRIGRDALSTSRFARRKASTAIPASGMLLITLVDGSTVVGVVTSSNADGITVESPNGSTTHIPYRLITRQTPVSLDEIGSVVQMDPNRSRLLFAPTGRPLEAGHGYFSVSEIFFPMIAVGVTDWLSFAAGMSLVPSVESQLLYFNVKLTPLSTPTSALSLGTFYTLLPILSGEGVGVVYGVGTFGYERTDFTIGGGFLYSDYLSEVPVLVAGFETQISSSAMILSENYYIPAAEAGLISLGIRFFGEHLAGDFGMLLPSDWDSDMPFIPWLGLAYNF